MYIRVDYVIWLTDGDLQHPQGGKSYDIAGSIKDVFNILKLMKISIEH